ncbi:MAG TPA: hypothetical protein VHY08_16430 [Bacillota bacterium]|nr:hypothetical protein [Bacillota bacterium]
MIRKSLFLGILLLIVGILVTLTGCDLGKPQSDTYYTLTITISPSGAGTVTPASGSSFKKGSVAALAPHAAAGYIFDRWEGLNGAEVTNYKITMNSDKYITAVFVPSQHTLNIEVIPYNVGHVNQSLHSQTVYDTGSTVDLLAVSDNSDYVFDRWVGDLTGSQNPATLLMNGEKNVTAVFKSLIPTPTPITDSSVISPAVTLNDPRFQVESVYIGKAGSASTYIYGIVKIKYLGASDLLAIDVVASFKDQSNNQIFSDDSYVWNVVPCKWTNLSENTTTFFTLAHNYGYYYIITNLNNYGITIADISNIDLTITYQSYSYIAPLGTMSTTGSPYRVEPDSWYINVKNNGDRKIHSDQPRVIFKDSLNRQFQWTSGIPYVNGVFNQTFDIGQTGYIKCSYVTPDYISTPLEFGEIPLSWSPDTTSGTSLNIQSILKDRSITEDEKNMLIKEQMDEYTRLQSEKCK